MVVMRALRLACLLFFVLAPAARAFQMGMPGMVGQDGDVVLSASTGIQYNLILDAPVKHQYDSIFQYNVLGKIGYAPVKWFEPVAMVGGATYKHKRSDFVGKFAPMFGLQLRFAPVNNDKGFFFAIDPGMMYQPIRGSIGSTADLKAHKVDFAGGATFGYNADRVSFFAGGRYTYLFVKEQTQPKLKNHSGGIYGGVDYFVTPNVYFGLEAQNFDSQAIFAGVGGRF